MELRRKSGRVVMQVRRSIRLRKNNSTFLEDTEEFQDQAVMDDDHSPALSEDDVTTTRSDSSHPDVMGAKNWTVMLNRLDQEEDSEKKEDEEKEDARKTGKQQHASRIPAFHKTLAKKRPTTTSSSTTTTSSSQRSDPPASSITSKESSNQAALTSSSGEMSRSKLPNIKETGLPLPTVRLHKLNPQTLSHAVSSSEQSPSSLDVTPPEGDQEQLHPMTATPRPALRAEAGDYDDPGESLHTTGAAQKATEEEFEADFRMDGGDVPSGHAEKESLETDEGEEDETDLNQPGDDDDDDDDVETGYEENPCQAEAMEIEFLLEEDGDGLDSSPLLEEKELEKPSVETESFSESEVVRENQDKSANKERASGKWSKTLEDTTVADTAVPSNRAVPRRTAKPSQSNKTSWCWSFALFCLFPSTLLVIGGFGQHVWHYGMPLSVSQLMGQLELHWLEGLWVPHEPCNSDCRVSLVESIPDGLFYPLDSSSLPSISDTWTNLLTRANSSVDIAAFYFTLRDIDLGFTEPSAAQGKQVFKQLMELEAKGVKLQIAVNGPQNDNRDTADLARTGAEVREVDLQSVTGGIVHTKLWVVDQKHLYLGSANMDWRSLTQVKEVGVSMEDCSCLAQDASRIFGVYWNIGAQKNGSLPPFWPARYSALSSSKHPLNLKLNGVPARVYLSSAPPQISAYGRSDDLSTILSVIADAQKYVHISVMDYLPLSQFTEPLRFWPAIDSALRAAACTRGVEVNLLVSCWSHSPGSMFLFLQSLTVLNRPPLGCNINVALFEVPSTAEQKKIPFSRVNHAKYMVTDRVVYIGTSNWSENYFTHTAGIGLVVNQTGSVVAQGQRSLQVQLQEVFLRDWTSRYARILSNDDVKHCGR
ncbi:5'-3' exonuclease PLD4 isoform X2 [Oncorhynchus clarkii lewisi]|uniref:5'-3' exonuclease PLD4 isoform X2 n=1 Tax=Oncorhynchus clarkii lewisi TaxID=490388 RepID=UPI0039B82C14